MRRYSADPFQMHNQDNPATSGRALDWEESALDSRSEVEGFAEEVRNPLQWRWLYLTLGLITAVLCGQLLRLQIVQGEKYRAMADGNRLRIQTILAPRGYIVDNHDEVIARNSASFSLVVTPIDLPAERADELIGRVAGMFGVPAEEIRAKLQKSGGNKLLPIVLKRGLNQEESILFETQAQELPGFDVASIPVRDYLHPEVFSHLLGYTGAINEQQYQELQDQGYAYDDLIGQSGIELTYENYLHGTNGNRQLEVDATGRPLKSLGGVDPAPGKIVKLNIDAGLQKKLYDEFISKSPNIKGAAVALNPKTGAVLALVSVPGFNNNAFAPGIGNADYQALLSDKRLPLFNRAIAGAYPPGSTIKMVTAAAALQEGVVNADTTIYDGGKLVIPNQYNPAISYNFVGWKREGLGPMNVRSAIAQSSDIYFYTVAGGHPGSPINGLGAEKLASYYRKFGMGALTGIDLKGEKPGLVADPNWKAEYHKDNKIESQWYLGDTYHIAIGQGDMLTTPLQVATWTAAIANNGTFNQPLILAEVRDQNGQVIFKPTPQVLINPSIDPGHMRTIQLGMRDNVMSGKGSGRQLQSLPISAAGKTGTSQFDGSDPSRTHAWYTAYAPFEDPQIVITVLVEAGGEGHAAAVPIVKNALQWWAENRLGK